MASDDKTDLLLALMSMTEEFPKVVEISKRVETMKFEDVSRTTWAEVVSIQPIFQMILQTLIDQTPNVAKLVTNEAALAHVQAVMDAD